MSLHKDNPAEYFRQYHIINRERRNGRKRWRYWNETRAVILAIRKKHHAEHYRDRIRKRKVWSDIADEMIKDALGESFDRAIRTTGSER